MVEILLRHSGPILSDDNHRDVLKELDIELKKTKSIEV